MRLFSRFLLVMALCLQAKLAVAQVNTDSAYARQFKMNPNYNAFSFHLGPAAIRQTYLSPVKAQGAVIGLSSSSVAFRHWGYHEFGSVLHVPIFDQPEEMMGLHLQLAYTPNWMLANTGGVQWYAGIQTMLDFPLLFKTASAGGYNSAQMVIDLQLRPQVGARYPFVLGAQRFVLWQKLNIHLAGVGIYPLYGAQDYSPMSDPLSDDSKMGVHWMSLHNTFGLVSSTSLDWRIGKPGQVDPLIIRFGYDFIGQRTRFERVHQYAYSYFSLGFVSLF